VQASPYMREPIREWQGMSLILLRSRRANHLRISSKKPGSRRGGQRDFLKGLGPGLITGASDDDPSGIGTYSQAGAQFGFTIGWTMLLTYPLMVGIQEISARIGRVTGHGIAGNVRRNFPAPAVWFLTSLLFTANTIDRKSVV